MSGREAFESVMRALGFDHPDRDHLGAMMKIAWAVWSARDAELAAKDARIVELEDALRMILIQDQFLHRDPTGEPTYYYNSFDVDVLVNDALKGEEG